MYYNFFKIVEELSKLEDDMLVLSQNIDRVVLNNNVSGELNFKKNLLKSSISNIDNLIDTLGNKYQNNYFTFIKADSTSNEYYCSFEIPIYLKKLQLMVSNFSYDLVVEKPLTNFEILIESDVFQSRFFAIPNNHIGDYIELVRLNFSEDKSKFKCKNSHPVKIYDRSFKLMNISYSITYDGYIQLPKLSGDELYICYTPMFDSYEYAVNKNVNRIIIKTDTPLDASQFKMLSY